MIGPSRCQSGGPQRLEAWSDGVMELAVQRINDLAN